MELKELLSKIQSFSLPSKDKDCNLLCELVIQYCSSVLGSEQYQKIIEEQNRRWTYLFDEEYSETKENPSDKNANECENGKGRQILPATSVNCKELLKKIKEELHRRFGDYFEVYYRQDSNGMGVHKIKEYIPPLHLFGDVLTDSDYANKTYLPTNIEDIIKEWIGGDERLDAFAVRVAKDYCSFKRSKDEQKRFIILDIFYSALELRLKNLPSAKKIDNDYSKSIYMIPDFLRHELSLMLPFYTYNEDDEIDNPLSIRRKADKESGHTPSINIRKYYNYSIYDESIERVSHPLAYNNQITELDLSKLITKDISIRRSYNGPSMILKFCYPLYIFIYNNIVKELVKKPEAIASRIKGCKFATSMSDKKAMDISHIIEAMQFFDSHKKKVPDKLDVLTNLYALRQFQNYMYRLICIFNHALVKYKKDAKIKFPPFISIGFNWKKGNYKSESEKKIDVRCDLALTTWLFIRYSELFRLALMANLPKDFIEDKKIIDGWKCEIIWPKNFFTAFNFHPNALKNYPFFHKAYNDFIDIVAKELYVNMKHIDVSYWLIIAQKIGLNVPSPFSVEALLSHEILSLFFSDIGFSSSSRSILGEEMPKENDILFNPTFSDERYNFDEKKFEKLLEMKRFIDRNQANQKR